MRKIEKKTWPTMFEKILSGTKNFDMRIADFECEPGDTLILKEYDPGTQKYTGREISKKITFVLKTKDQKFWKKEDIEKYGFLVMGLK
ncbi:DUF3850 domain-containing protein [Candidatus Woesebacteria bacterium]|nr:DUF3850 domain-containing protein [Candidatus Woesebacteria bacterium]QQG47727.1 MAG: DUF3850 domain-containing protein [Candidatus Woesebacteria bacterium]